MFMKNFQAELATFLYATCFSPVKSTSIKDVKNGNFTTWPSLISKLISARPPKPEGNIFGHLDQTEKNSYQQIVSNYNWRWKHIFFFGRKTQIIYFLP